MEEILALNQVYPSIRDLYNRVLIYCNAITVQISEAALCSHIFRQRCVLLKVKFYSDLKDIACIEKIHEMRFNQV